MARVECTFRVSVVLVGLPCVVAAKAIVVLVIGSETFAANRAPRKVQLPAACNASTVCDDERFPDAVRAYANWHFAAFGHCKVAFSHIAVAYRCLDDIVELGIVTTGCAMED